MTDGKIKQLKKRSSKSGGRGSLTSANGKSKKGSVNISGTGRNGTFNSQNSLKKGNKSAIMAGNLKDTGTGYAITDEGDNHIIVDYDPEASGQRVWNKGIYGNVTSGTSNDSRYRNSSDRKDRDLARLVTDKFDKNKKGWNNYVNNILDHDSEPKTKNTTKVNSQIATLKNTDAPGSRKLVDAIGKQL